MKPPLQPIIRFLKQSKKTILLIAIVVLVTLLLSGLISIWLYDTHNLHIPSFATIKTLGVKAYWDSSLRNQTTEILWPSVYPGMSYNVTLYLQSVSNIKALLKLRTENWAFQSSNGTIVSGPTSTTPYMNLTWNYSNTMVYPGETLQVTLTLSVDRCSDFIEFLIANDVKAFSVDIIISTSE